MILMTVEISHGRSIEVAIGEVRANCLGQFDKGRIGQDVERTRPPQRHFIDSGDIAGPGRHVAGIASGNSLFGGQMSGAAPGAKLVSVRACLFITGCTNHAMVEGMRSSVRAPAANRYDYLSA